MQKSQPKRAAVMYTKLDHSEWKRTEGLSWVHELLDTWSDMHTAKVEPVVRCASTGGSAPEARRQGIEISERLSHAEPRKGSNGSHEPGVPTLSVTFGPVDHTRP